MTKEEYDESIEWHLSNGWPIDWEIMEYLFDKGEEE